MGNWTASAFRRAHVAVVRSEVECRRIWAMVRKDEFDKIAAEMQDLLIREWDAQTSEAIRDVIRAVKGSEKFSAKQLNDMIDALRPRLGDAFANTVASDLLEYLPDTYGAAINEVIGITPTFNLTDKKALAALEQYAIYPVQHHFDAQLEDKIRKFGSQIIEEGLSLTDAGKLFENEFAKKYNIESFRYWEGYANFITTRTREFGAVSGYERAEIEYAEVRAVLDHRTTEICRHMHGRLIPVKKMVEVRNALMNNQDPEAVKEITPFETAKTIAETPSDKLPNGAVLPPYHFGPCRTRTRTRRTVTTTNQVSDRQMGRDVSRANRKKLNRLTDEEYSNWLQTIRGKRSFNFDADSAEKMLEKHGPGFGISDMDDYIDKGREIIRNRKGVLVRTMETDDANSLFRFHFYSDAGEAVVGEDLLLHAVIPHDAPENSFRGRLSGGLRLEGPWDF